MALDLANYLQNDQSNTYEYQNQFNNEAYKQMLVQAIATSPILKLEVISSASL